MEEGRAGMGDKRVFLTAAACKLAGGQWKGGHDISGHVFLLVLGSAFLWMEILPTLVGRESRLVKRREGDWITADRESEGERVKQQKEAARGLSVPLIVAGLSWWMLLMTAAYFHTWFEKVSLYFRPMKDFADILKFTGLIVAFAGIGVVYFLPRVLPDIRETIGIPGI